MIIVFRVDAHPWMGLGHLMRCLSLADSLTQFGAQCHFVCRGAGHDLYDRVAEQGYQLHQLAELTDVNPSPLNESEWLCTSQQQDAAETLAIINSLHRVDWLIVDHYGIHKEWEETVSARVGSVAVIDDIPQRQHCCQLLLDQTLGRKAEEYSELLPRNALTLVGSEYCLLRSEFSKSRQQLTVKSEPSAEISILISMGGGRGTSIAAVCVGLLVKQLPRVDGRHYKIHQVGGDVPAPETGHRDDVEIHHHNFIDQMDVMLRNAHVAIGAPGGATWERMAMGVPSVVIPFADNQRQVANALREAQVGVVLSEDELPEKLSGALLELLKDFSHHQIQMMTLIDALGTKRVAQYIAPQVARDDKPVYLKAAQQRHIDVVYEWQGREETRRYARNQAIPAYSDHVAWMKAKLADHHCYFNIIYHGSEPAGVVRLDRQAENQYEVSINIAPEKFGLGIASIALSLLDRFLPAIQINATVLAGNKASHTLFQRAGYTKVAEDLYHRLPLSDVLTKLDR